ncbi:hypothetical protein FWC63_02515 [Candidatus Saccharibacteria bacterium]|nr:hypothetical protein [Candidatus Saccharibacteria bacterium]
MKRRVAVYEPTFCARGEVQEVSGRRESLIRLSTREKRERDGESKKRNISARMAK